MTANLEATIALSTAAHALASQAAVGSSKRSTAVGPYEEDNSLKRMHNKTHKKKMVDENKMN